MFLTLTVTTNAWGATATYTLNSSNNGGSVTTGNVSWSIASGAITVQNGNCKLTGTITVTLPTGATLNKVSIAKSNTWGSGATVTFKTGSTTLNTFSNSGDYTLTTNKDKLTYTFSKSGTSSKNAWVKSITVDYTVAAYTVTYNANGGSGTMSNSTGSSISLKGCTFTAPSGKEFKEWNTNASGNGKSYQPGDVVTESLDLYAIWQELPKYTVTLEAGSGTCAASVAETSAGKGVTLPTPTLDCDGWTFAGWTTSAVATETSSKPATLLTGSYKPTSNITLYAVYQRTETPLGGGSSEEIVDFSEQNYTNGEVISTYTGTNFSVAFNKGTNSNEPKYYTSGTAIRIYGGGYFTVSSESTITKIVITFGSSDGSNAITTDVDTYSNGTWTGSANSVKFTIGGSSGNRRIKSLAVTTSGGGSTTTYYHSTPECTPPCATVTIENATSIGGFSLSINTEAVTSPVENCGPVNLIITIVPYDGYQIQEVSNALSVNIDDHGTATVTYEKNSTIDSKVTLVPRSYDVVLHTNEGTINAGNVTSYKYGVGATLPTNITKNGYVFGGWFEEETFYGTKVTTISTTETGNKEYWAKWDPAVYAINYKDQGNVAYSGSNAASLPKTHTYATATTLVDGEKIGYTFRGWYKEKDCSGTEVTTLGATEYTENITLYAKWTANTYTITLDANGGTFVDKRDSQTKGSATFDYIYGTYATYNDAPNLTDYYTDLKRTGYQFDKWVSAGSPWNKLFTSTGDRTIQAQWSKLYTITLSENGTTKELDAQTSTSYTLPTELSAGSCLDDTKELVGWSTVEIPNPGDKPTSNFYELGATVTLTADQTTFYAVFATVGEGGVDNTDYSNVHTSNVTLTNEGGTNAANSKVKISEVDYIAVKAGTGSAQGAVKITVPAGTTKLSFHMAGWNKEGGKTISLTGATADPSSFKTVADAGVSGSSTTYTLSGTIADYFYSTTLSNINTETTLTFSNGGADQRFVIWGVNASTGGGVSYSDYTTTCVKLPDPVLSFATEPANPIVFTDVACGGNSSKQSVTVVGENLRDVVEVSVTGPYKIARTSSTALKDFTTSLTLDKTAAGAIHDNYKTVYIISTPPAQSTEATTGTLTLTTTKGNTLIVNLSTPTVTCTQYTLTLNDRGTKTTAEYYAGASVPKPKDPTGVCTDPIHYVFDGWAEATVAEGSTTYTKVSFPYTIPKHDQTLYAVYRYVEDGGADSGDYVKVTENLDDYSGDYLIVYETGSVAFDGGRNHVDDDLDATNNTIEVTITANTIASNATTDAAKFTIAKVDGGYSIQSASGYYIGRSATSNGLSANETYSANYDLNTITDYKTIKGKGGNILKYNKASDQKRFRYYQSAQEDIALYRKAASYLYTTSPICGPHLAITEGKDIYVTGGNAGGTRDLVIAQQKVSYKATRLNVGPTSQVPDVKVATNGITVGGVVTTDVKVTIDQTKEQQTDGTYTITGTITVQYQPSANGKQEDIQVQLAVDYNAEARDNFTVHARSLPSEFVIVAKSGSKWYALNADMSGDDAELANGQVTLDNDANPTKANYAPCNAIYTFDGVPNTGDRTRVRFQGTDGAWLWASSGTNVGIQNKSLKDTPEGNNKAYNWKLETDDNTTYKFHNDNSSRLLGLSGEKFGMYASGVQEFRILPYEAKCLYNYAPTNLKVSVLKGSYVTLTWDAVAGATKYQYSTDGTTWIDAGTEPTVTINGLEDNTKYIYYIRAYHEDAGVSQECIDYAEITFTTANCDDVPTNITYTADLNSITVSWTAAAPTATITYNTKEDGTGGGGTINNATSPYTISGGLNPNTTYYIQILADGTCGSPIIPVKTEDVKMDIVEWQPDGIVVDINTNEKVKVTLENEVSYGSGTGTVAEDLFFSKYFEGSGSLKMLAIYNGTGKDVDLSTYRIDRGTNGDATDISKTYDLSQLGIIKQGQEIVFYSWPLAKNTQGNPEYSYECSKSYLNNVATKSGQEDNPRWILCGNDPTGNATPIYDDAMNFSGDDPLLLRKNEVLIDVIGVSNAATRPTKKTLCTGRSEEAWSADGVTNMDYGKTEEDFEDGEIPHGVNVDDETITAYTARVIMFRKNTVVSGDDAVTKNIDNFVTFADEWEARQVCMSGDDGDLTCAAYQELGKFNYSEYYTKYESMDQDQEFDTNNRNADGTLTVPITELFKQSCRNIKITLKDAADNVLKEQPYKVPIMITSTQGTDGQAFLALQENLATVEVDNEGNPTGNKTNLTLEQVREICKTCDVVVRDNAILTKAADDAADDHPEVHDIYVYENSSLIVPNGTNYTINNLSLRRKGDQVSSLSAYPDALKLPESAATPISLDLRVDANNWHWFTLPYNCNIADVTWVDGSAAQYNVDWFLMTYDGAQRANTQSGGCWKQYNGTTIEAGKGYIVGITGDLTNPNYTFELRFPMAKEVLANEGTDKTVDVRAWGVETNIRPNHKGWNLVGNPYLAYYQRDNITKFEGLRLGELTGPDLQTGYWEQTGDVPYVVIPIEGGWVSYEQVLASETDLMPFTAYFVQVGNDEKHNSSDELSISFDHTKLQLSATPMPASIVRRAPAEIEETEEPIIVGVSLTNGKGESDKTSLVIDDRFTNEYEMNGDFFKWFGDYYNYYTKPVLYTIGADQGKRAFNALNEELAKQPIPMGMYAAQTGNYTFSLNKRADLSRVEEVWLYDATQSTYTNLMQSDYTFSTSKVNGTGRFSLSVKLAPKVATSIDNLTADKVWATTHTKQVIVNGLESGMHLWLYDATGKLLYNEPTSNYQHTYAVPQTGTYFVSVMKGNAKQTIKVVVE